MSFFNLFFRYPQVIGTPHNVRSFRVLQYESNMNKSITVNTQNSSRDVRPSLSGKVGIHTGSNAPDSVARGILGVNKVHQHNSFGYGHGCSCE